MTVANLEPREHGEMFPTTLRKLGESLGIDGGELYVLYVRSVREGEGREGRRGLPGRYGSPGRLAFPP